MITTVGKYLDQIGGGVKQKDPDRWGTKPLKFDFNDEGVKQFNEIYQYLKKANLREMQRGRSGAILKSCRTNRYGSWDYSVSNTGAMITVRIEGYTFVYKIGHVAKESENNISGRKAFDKFVDICYEKGINLDDYIIDNGAEVKETIPAPKISMNQYMTIDDEPLHNCHHVDFHNSYPAGLCNTHPEFRPIIEPIYENRKTEPVNKAILNYSIGFMQSLKTKAKARWAHLSKDAITDNNNRIEDLSRRLEESGRRILGYNTDGIWYQGEIYHGEGEGSKLGEWENDHTCCLFRSKSDGAYEFIEFGEYHPVVRGATKLDSVKDRKDWKWGDIYREGSVILLYYWNEDIGYVKEETAL